MVSRPGRKQPQPHRILIHLRDLPARRALAGFELRWIEIDALAAWPALEDFLAIIFYERQRDICVAERVDAGKLTADEAVLLVSLVVARWDTAAAARLRSALSRQSALSEESIFDAVEIH